MDLVPPQLLPIAFQQVKYFVHHSVDHFLALYVGVAWGTSITGWFLQKEST